jgi:hypothetical protein
MTEEIEQEDQVIEVEFVDKDGNIRKASYI